MIKLNMNLLERNLNYTKGNQMEIRNRKDEKSNLIKLGEPR
jgi:hypothetical protein